MYRTPSNADLQRLILDLCRATAMLRVVETRGALSGGGECDRLADSIDAWLNNCESRITPILEDPDCGEAKRTNVLEFSGKFATRHAPAPVIPAPAPAATSASEEQLRELRNQLRKISAALQRV